MVELRKKGWNTVRARTLSEAPDGYNLENAVGREKDVQAIDLDSVMKKCVVTLLVISTFFI
jgi:hypothetical protein